jgi:hypothetical protein
MPVDYLSAIKETYITHCQVNKATGEKIWIFELKKRCKI